MFASGSELPERPFIMLWINSSVSSNFPTLCSINDQMLSWIIEVIFVLRMLEMYFFTTV
jgi:hypothetical protein